MSFIFLGMATTGILSFMEKYSEAISAFHVVFSFTFLLIAIFHIFNNIKPLKKYFSDKKHRIILLITLILVSFIAISATFQLPPFSNFINLGKNLRKNSEISKKVEYQIKTHSDIIGKTLKIDFRAGSEYTSKTKLPDGRVITSIPQFAIWIADKDDKFLETLYVSGKSAKGSYSNGARRPESLPIWSHARNIKSSDGLMMPSKEKPLPDALTGATPLTSFTVISKYKETDSLKLMIEVNKSFDPNEYFNKKTFANDKVYVKSPNGQPSLLYSVNINKGDSGIKLATLIGHGHISGANGSINIDLSKFTTALKILKGIIVEY
jgi:hypothetical protein